MIKKLIFYYFRRFEGRVHPQELYEILIAIKKTYKTNIYGMPVKWEHRKFLVAGEYALGFKTVDEIAKEYNITRTRVEAIAWRIYHDYQNGVYNERN
jgi:hypothetical protein